MANDWFYALEEIRRCLGGAEHTAQLSPALMEPDFDAVRESITSAIIQVRATVKDYRTKVEGKNDESIDKE